MLQPRAWASGSAPRILTTASCRPNNNSLITALSRLAITPSNIQTRNASHASQGRANKAAPGPGKRLGAKKSDSEPVVPGNIIFRQRGTLWFPGENVTIGRDHTISATAKGFVRYYRDPERHPERKYIGVVFEQHEQLPRGRNASRRRRLGLDAVVVDDMPITPGEQLADNEIRSETPSSTVDEIATSAPGTNPQVSLRQGSQYRESNWSIGRIADRKGVYVAPFDKANRWSRWRIAVKKKKKFNEMEKIKKDTKSAKKGNKKKRKAN